MKINVYLNEEEKKMLEEKSTKTKLSQSDFIRNLITDFKENSLSKQDINYIADSLQESITGLLKLKKGFIILAILKMKNFYNINFQILIFG